MIEIKHKTTGKVLRTVDADTLDEANLRRVDLCEANLCEANLWRVDLCEAHLRGANLRGANLCEANLWRVDLCEAHLRGANLRGTNLMRANLRGAKGIISLGPIGSEGRIIYAVDHGDKAMVKAGCFWGDLDQLGERVKEKHGDNTYGRQYKAAIEMIKAWHETQEEGE